MVDRYECTSEAIPASGGNLIDYAPKLSNFILLLACATCLPVVRVYNYSETGLQ